MHYPDLDNVERWKMALEKVETPYVCFCPDDDFHGFNALKRCVSFLNENMDYSSVQGRYLGYTANINKAYKIVYDNTFSYHVKSNVMAERIIEAVTPYMINLWAVHRSSNLKSGFIGLESINGRMLELHFTLIAAIYGKLKVLPFFYSLREIAPISWGKTEPSITTWMSDNNGKNEFEAWKVQITNLISDTQSLPHKDSLSIVENFLASYIEYIIFRNRNNQSVRYSILNAAKIALRFMLPRQFINKMKAAMGKDLPVNEYTIDELFSRESAIGILNRQNYDLDNPATQYDWSMIQKVI